jgi:hypothetical protein
MAADASPGGRVDNASRERLVAVAAALRALHRALAERARRDFEQARQTVLSPGEWLQRLIGDPQFAWLRELSELMVDLDVFLEADPGPASDDAASVRGEIERLLAAPGNACASGDFPSRYWPYVHDDPPVAIAHGEVRQAIEHLPQSRDINEADALHARHGWAAARRHRT